jgi:hypothetical protein
MLNYRIASDNLTAAQEIMGQKANASRTNAQLDAARAQDEAGSPSCTRGASFTRVRWATT